MVSSNYTIGCLYLSSSSFSSYQVPIVQSATEVDDFIGSSKFESKIQNVFYQSKLNREMAETRSVKLYLIGLFFKILDLDLDV